MSGLSSTSFLGPCHKYRPSPGKSCAGSRRAAPRPKSAGGVRSAASLCTEVSDPGSCTSANVASKARPRRETRANGSRMRCAFAGRSVATFRPLAIRCCKSRCHVANRSILASIMNRDRSDFSAKNVACQQSFPNGFRSASLGRWGAKPRASSAPFAVRKGGDFHPQDAAKADVGIPFDHRPTLAVPGRPLRAVPFHDP
jgi:hypothetical protein